ncbi:MAG: nicotinate (nicotinamide) nucleotide adenylyltransferase [Flavitalea sp.]
MRIGLYFGSFNPIHTGHLIIANHILNESALEKIWFVVSPQNPIKSSATLLNEYDRLHLVNLAINGDDRLRTSEIEFSLPKPSYTSHTLAYLSEKYREHQFAVIMGSDSFQNLKNWRNAQSIVRNFPLIIYRRPGFDILNETGANITVMNAPLLEISASQIRENVHNGKSIKYLVPDVVKDEIEKGGYYKNFQKK